jgi:hypothetical protein
MEIALLELPLAAMATIAAVAVIASIGMWITFVPVWLRAIRTGRLRVSSVTYDRHTTPVRYWLGFLGMVLITTMVSALAAGMAVDTATRLGFL